MTGRHGFPGLDWSLLALVCGAAMLSWLIVRAVRGHAVAWGLVDTPNHRSSHVAPTPRGGGLGIVAGGTAAAGYLGWHGAPDWLWPLAWLSVAIAMIGLWDDRRGLSILPRLLVQLVACAGIIMIWPGALGLTGGVLLLLGAVWWLNLFNFMDGIDGLAACQALYMLAVAAGMAAVDFGAELAGLSWMLAVAAATTGFLWWNWPPAKVFMGDVGSTYLAFMLFAFCLMSVVDGWLPLQSWLILGALFITDATLTLIARILRGEPWLQAHRQHLYQRLARRWERHRAVTGLVMAINVLYLAPLAWASGQWAEWAWAALWVAYAPILLAWLVLRKCDGP